MNKKVITVMLLISFLISSCGTIIYPERRGNRGGQIDPMVVLLDGLGLFFFIIPGVIAFAVDITTGAIYEGGGHHRDFAKNDDLIYIGNGMFYAPIASTPSVYNIAS